MRKINLQKYFLFNAPSYPRKKMNKVYFLPATHCRCFIPNCLFSAFSDHLLWPAWALGCRHPHYSRSNFLTKYLQTICLQTVSAKMIAIEMIQIDNKNVQMHSGTGNVCTRCHPCSHHHTQEIFK